MAFPMCSHYSHIWWRRAALIVTPMTGDLGAPNHLEGIQESLVVQGMAIVEHCVVHLNNSEDQRSTGTSIPRSSMYGIFTYIWVIYGVNVGKYTIHGWSGIYSHPSSRSKDISLARFVTFGYLGYLEEYEKNSHHRKQSQADDRLPSGKQTVCYGKWPCIVYFPIENGEFL